MSTDLETNLQIIEEFTQRLQVAVIGAEETTNKHVDWVEGPVDGTIDTANGPLKTLRGQIAEWRLSADQDVASAINGYDTQFAAALTQFQTEFDAYLITVGFEPAVEYAAGILIERRAQTVVYDGVTYYWTSSLPYTTTGSFGTELSWQIAPIIGGIETPSFTFTSGGKLFRKTQSVLGLDGEWYYWTGTFPKTIAAASTLESAGGVGENLFKISSGFPPLRPTLKLLSTSIGMELNVGSFEGGATLTAQDEVLAQFLTGKLYKWNGVFPKVVDLHSTPSSSGGISPTGWSEIEKSSNQMLAIEALRRGYADAGFILVGGSFETGGTLTGPDDVLIHMAIGKAYAGIGPFPQIVDPDTDPSTAGFIDKSGVILRDATQHMRNELVNGVVYPSKLNDTIVEGDVVSSGTTHLRILVGGKTVIVQAWDSVTYPFTFNSAVANQFAGYDVTTNAGVFEFVSTEVKRRRDAGYIDGWGCVPGVLNDLAFQKAVDSTNHARMTVDEWVYRKIKLRSNFALEGDDNIGCILKQVQPTDATTGGFYKAPGDLRNVQFIGFAYDGQRKANPTSPYNHMCYIEVNGNEVVEDILAYRLNAKNAQEDFINVTSYSNTARVKRVKAKLCRFSTDADKVNLAGNPFISSGNGLRLWNRADPNTSYGSDVFVGCSTFGCEGELIRTVSDFKRGCKTFSIMNNITVNCLDCHHSVDGSFDGIIQGNVGRNEPTFSLGARPNMIEVQGEDISILGNEFDGGNVTTSFINVTDYGMPGEGNGTTLINIGHRSTDISVIGNKGKSVTQNVFNGINNFNSQWLNNSARNCTSHSFAQSSGTARNDATTGLPLTADGNKYAGNTERNNGLPLTVRNATGTVLGSNTDEYGNESLYLGGNSLVPVSVYAAFRQTAQADNFNPNPQLKLDAAGTGIEGWTCPITVVAATTKPLGAFNAVTINDDSTSANLEHVIAERYPAVKNEIVYMSLDILRNTAVSCGVLFQEYDAGGAFIASYFKDLASTPVVWTRYITKHRAVSANCASLRIGVLPASNFNNPPSTGKTDIARVYVGKVPVPTII